VPLPAPFQRITPSQWKTGAAAWLGWLFDGWDMHLYTLVATPLVASLLGAGLGSDAVKEKSAYIQAAFLAGWAVGGTFFGRLGDRFGRSRTLALTVLTYALCTGLCGLARNWQQLMVFRFLAALGIGGEWAVGASLLVETWPADWRPWMGAVLQTAVNLGILVAAAIVTALTWMPHPPSERSIFFLGVAPALLVFWIRRQVPEPEVWERVKAIPGILPGALFRGPVGRTTAATTAVCAFSLSGWWLFLFWNPQYLRQLLVQSGTTPAETTRWTSAAFFALISVSIFGNFAGGWLARRWGLRAAIQIMLFGLFASMVGALSVNWGFSAVAWGWFPLVGFFSGVFGLFTVYLPPLFPTALRTTGTGFSYNVGRLAAAAAAIVFGWLAPVGNFRQSLLCCAALPLIAALLTGLMPRENPER
jgi:MFS family permease